MDNKAPRLRQGDWGKEIKRWRISRAKGLAAVEYTQLQDGGSETERTMWRGRNG